MPGDFLYVSLLNTFSTSSSTPGSTTFVNNITNNNTYQIVTGGTTNVTQNVSSYSGPAISAGTTSQGSGTVVFGNSNGVSFGLSAGTVTASISAAGGGGAAISAGGGSQSSGTVVFSNSNGVSFGMDGAGVVTASFSGGTGGADGGNTIAAGTQTAASNGLVIFSNAGGVSFGLSGSTVTATVKTDYLTTAQPPGAYLTTAALSQDSSKYAGTNGAITGGSITVNTSGVSVNLPAYLTTAMASNAGTGFMSTSERANFFATSNNTFANSTHSHGNPTLALTNILGTTASASNGFTLSLSVNPGGAGDGGNVIAVAGSTASSTGTILFSNASGVSFGLNAGTLTASVATNYLTTAMASNEPHLRAIVYSDATQTSGSLYLSGSNGITIRSGANTAIIEFDGHHMDALIPSGNGYGTGFSSMTSGTIGLSAGQGVSFSQNGNVLGMQVATNYQSQGAYLTTAAQSGHTHGSGPSITGSISVTSQSNAWSISIPAFLTTAQPVGAYLTTARASNDAVGLNTAATSVTWTVNSGGISLNAGAYLTTAMASNAGSNFMSTSERANYFATNANTFANSTHTHGGLTINVTNLTTSITSASNGLTINLSAGAPGGGGAAISAGTNSRSSGTVVFANSNGVTFGMDTNGSITATVVPGAAAGIAAFGGSNTTYTSGTVALTGAGAITVGSDTGQKIVVSGPALTSLTGVNGVSLSSNGSTISIGMNTLNGFDPFGHVLRMTGQVGQSSIYIFPVQIPAPLSFDRVVVPVSYTNATNSSNQFFVTMGVALYTNNAGSLSRAFSSSSGYQTTNSGTQGAMTGWLGARLLTIGWSTSIPPGDYWIAVHSITTTTGGAGMSMSQLLVSTGNSALSGVIGVGPANSNQMRYGQGIWNAQTASFPASIGFTAISGSASAAQRPPILYFTNGSA